MGMKGGRAGGRRPRCGLCISREMFATVFYQSGPFIIRRPNQFFNQSGPFWIRRPALIKNKLSHWFYLPVWRTGVAIYGTFIRAGHFSCFNQSGPCIIRLPISFFNQSGPFWIRRPALIKNKLSQWFYLPVRRTGVAIYGTFIGAGNQSGPFISRRPISCF